MLLEEGCFYVTREGHTVGPLYYDNTPGDEYFSYKGRMWKPNGLRYYGDDSYIISHKVGEEPPVVEPNRFTGKYARLECGLVVGPIQEGSSNYYYTYPLFFGETRWSADGSHRRYKSLALKEVVETQQFNYVEFTSADYHGSTITLGRLYKATFSNTSGYFLIEDDFGGDTLLYVDDYERSWVAHTFPEVIVESPDVDPVSDSWGEGHSGDFNDRDPVYAFLKKYAMEHPALPRIAFRSGRLVKFHPTKSVKFPGQISIYRNMKEYHVDRRTAMKIGRAMKVMFPELSDADLEKLVDAYKREFPILHYTVREGKEAQDFKRAYSHVQSDFQNVYTTSYRKSLANSCMRHKFESFPIHPAETYASGDFTIIWVEDQSGRIAGRCVVYTGHPEKPQAGPVYGVCEGSIDLIVEHLNAMGAVHCAEGANWRGAKMVRYPYNGKLVGPYLDMIQTLRDEGDHLVIDRDGPITASDYQGWLGGCSDDEGGVWCCHCEDYHDEESGRYYCNDFYCDSCFSECFQICDYDGEYYPLDDNFCEVSYQTAWSRRIYTQTVHESNLEGNYVDTIDDGWWAINDCIELPDGEWVSPNGKHNYVQSTLDDAWYHIDDVGTLVSGEVWPFVELESRGYTINDDGEWELKVEEAA